MKKTLLIVLFIATFFYAVNAFAECIEGDCTNGRGTLITADGIKYVGQFKTGKPDGMGTSTFPDGTEYVGRFKDGRFNGQGTYTQPDGKEYAGEFKDGELVSK